jgi:hypothetical protein
MDLHATVRGAVFLAAPAARARLERSMAATSPSPVDTPAPGASPAALLTAMQSADQMRLRVRDELPDLRLRHAARVRDLRRVRAVLRQVLQVLFR